MPDASCTVVFIDYDDTLLCSTWLTNQDLLHLSAPDTALPRHVQEELKRLDFQAVCVLERVLRLTKRVCVLTNSDAGWVEQSSQRFLPHFHSHLKHVEVCSARSLFEDKYPDKPSWWKVFAMQQRLMPWFSAHHVRKNFVSIGDSFAEREALQLLCRNKAQTWCKVVKMADKPTVGSLIRQLELLCQTVEWVVIQERSLDLLLTVSDNDCGPSKVLEVVQPGVE